MSNIQIAYGKIVKPARFEGKKSIYLERGRWGTRVILAPPRYGKSCLVKNLICQVANDTSRRVVIFDYRGEYDGCKFPNALSKDRSLCIYDMFSVKNIKLKLIDMAEPEMWVSLGYTQNSAKLLSELSEMEDIHHNDFEVFYDKLVSNPGFYVKRRVHPMVQDKITECYEYKDLLTVYEGDTYVEDWQNMVIRHRHLHIDLDINSVSDQQKAQLLVGYILKQFSDSKFLLKYKLYMVFEEADLLFPNTEDYNIPLSLDYIESFVLKWQKYNPSMLFIAQMPEKLSPTIVNSASEVIYGYYDNIEYTRYLKWDPDVANGKGYREFIIKRKGQGFSDIFCPDDVYCF